eukprot:3839649-Pyramimonas_sp.AAC.1
MPNAASARPISLPNPRQIPRIDSSMTRRTFHSPRPITAKSPRPCGVGEVAALLDTLLVEHLGVLVDDGDGEQDAGAGANGAEEVRGDGERANAHAAERRRGGDVAVQLLLEGGLAVALARQAPRQNGQRPTTFGLDPESRTFTEGVANELAYGSVDAAVG